MSTLQWGIVVWIVLMIVVIMYIKRIRRFMIVKPAPKQLIKEPMMKVFFNPFLEKPMWTLFNPKTRTWEWFCDATPNEAESFMDIMFTEEQGMKLIADREISSALNDVKDKHYD